MIIRVTQKLAKKIKVVPVSCLKPDPDPYADWTANLFIAARLQYIIVTNSRSLYSVVIPGRGITNAGELVGAIMSGLEWYMHRHGLDAIYFGHIAPEADTVAFSKTGDRRVMGSMNDLVVQARWALVNCGLSLLATDDDLNGMPMGMLAHCFPKEEYLSLIPDDPAVELAKESYRE